MDIHILSGNWMAEKLIAIRTNQSDYGHCWKVDAKRMKKKREEVPGERMLSGQPSLQGFLQPVKVNRLGQKVIHA